MISAPKAFSLACIAAISHLAKADQPVHCVKSQIAGYWTFEVSREAVKADLFSADSICTHELPNRLQIVPEDLEFTLPGETSDLYLDLKPDYSVAVLAKDKGQPTGEVGTWTVVYDQAIIVELPSRGAKYTANMRYSLKPEVQPAQYDLLKCGSNEAFNSRCDETMVGIKFNADNMVQCWVGYQTKAATQVQPRESDLASPFILAQTGAEVEAETDAANQSRGKLVNSFLDIPVEERIALAQTINEAGLSWTASAYEDGFEDGELGLAQTSAETYREFNDGSQAFEKALAAAQRYIDVDSSKLNIDDMPENWDWSDVNGYDFTARHIDQGHCGSCYMIATNVMMESRIKIRYGVEKQLSMQHRLDCSFINEGCHGGWGYLDGIFIENFGAVDEECAPYEGSIDPMGCAKWANCPVIAKVKNVRYLGGHYGGMTEADMIKEVRAKGPILIDFNAGPSFQAYKSGVLSESKKPVSMEFDMHNMAQVGSMSESGLFAYMGAPMSEMTNTKTQEQQGLQWSKLTHSTVIIGWGVDEKSGEKYWLVRNSYGPSWGENGNLRLRRGRNDFGCESENIALDPYLVQ